MDPQSSKIWPCPERLMGAPMSVWERPHINKSAKSLKRETKWERPQEWKTASESAHKQVGRPTIKCENQNEWNVTPLIIEIKSGEFSKTKTAAAVHSANDGENSNGFLVSTAADNDHCCNSNRMQMSICQQQHHCNTHRNNGTPSDSTSPAWKTPQACEVSTRSAWTLE